MAAVLEAEGRDRENLTFLRIRGPGLRMAGPSEARGSERLAAIREGVFSRAAPLRHERILVANARKGFAWEALRRAPEGGAVALAERNGRRSS